MYSFTNFVSSQSIGELLAASKYPRRMELKQRIFKARKDAGLTQEGLASVVKKTRGAVAQWENGDVRPRHSTLAAIADATGVDLKWLESGVSDDAVGLWVVGVVAAGLWREGDSTLEPYTLPIAPSPEYPPDAQRIYKVEGTSINRAVKPGEYIHAVNLIAADVTPQSGDMVVVCKSRHGLTEYTAKRLFIDGNRQMLRSESDDPQWADDVSINGDDETEITITDLVIAKWSPIGRL